MIVRYKKDGKIRRRDDVWLPPLNGLCDDCRVTLQLGEIFRCRACTHQRIVEHVERSHEQFARFSKALGWTDESHV